MYPSISRQRITWKENREKTHLDTNKTTIICKHSLMMQEFHTCKYLTPLHDFYALFNGKLFNSQIEIHVSNFILAYFLFILLNWK